VYGELQVAQEEKEELEASVASLTKRLADAQAERDDAIDERETLKSRLRRMQDELDSLREEFEDAQEQNDNLNAKLAAKVGEREERVERRVVSGKSTNF
jgi:chromosome segregation ATPase